MRPNPNKRFHWTAELDEMLRRAYKQAHNRRKLSASLDEMERRTGFSRAAILSRAAELRLNSPRRPWSEQETRRLAEFAGTLGKASIARKLGRSYWSVKAAFSRLEFSARLVEGFTREDIAGLLGASPRTVRGWIERGWLLVRDGRVTESSLRRFLCEHSEEYSLSRVDETWFKGMVFPMFGHNVTAPRRIGARPKEVAAVADWETLEQNAGTMGF